MPNNGLDNFVNMVHRRSKCTSYSKSTGQIEGISVLPVLAEEAIRTLPTDEILLLIVD